MKWTTNISSHSLASGFTHLLVSLDEDNSPSVTQFNSLLPPLLSVLFEFWRNVLSTSRSWTYFYIFIFKVVIFFLPYTLRSHFTWNWFLLQMMWGKVQDNLRMEGLFHFRFCPRPLSLTKIEMLSGCFYQPIHGFEQMCYGQHLRWRDVSYKDLMRRAQAG